MRMERGQPTTGPAIKGFTSQGYRLDDVTVAAALLLTTERASDWMPPPLAELTIESLEPALTPKPEFIVLGTGANLRRPPAVLIRALDERGIGLEPMDSRTAARTWSMLREEGRPIAAALYPLEA